jgi:hypothetical protein
MPFRNGDSDTPNTGSSTSTLRVEPDQVLRLKTELQTIYDEVEVFLRRRTPTMMMRPLGADPVSSDAADAFNKNTQSAIDAARGYQDALKGVLDTLDQAVRTYDLVEDANTQAFRQVVQ